MTKPRADAGFGDAVAVVRRRVEEADAARQSLFDRRNTRPLVEDLVDLAEGRCAQTDG